MTSFLADYEPVADRIERFYTDHPEGAIVTELVGHDGNEWVVKATIHRDEMGPVAATGLAHEVTGQGNVNKTSALENCETSAIGRALANLGYAAKGSPRPSREEMVKTTAPKADALVDMRATIRAHAVGNHVTEAVTQWLTERDAERLEDLDANVLGELADLVGSSRGIGKLIAKFGRDDTEEGS